MLLNTLFLFGAFAFVCAVLCACIWKQQLDQKNATIDLLKRKCQLNQHGWRKAEARLSHLESQVLPLLEKQETVGG